MQGSQCPCRCTSFAASSNPSRCSRQRTRTERKTRKESKSTCYHRGSSFSGREDKASVNNPRIRQEERSRAPGKASESSSFAIFEPGGAPLKKKGFENSNRDFHLQDLFSPTAPVARPGVCRFLLNKIKLVLTVSKAPQGRPRPGTRGWEHNGRGLRRAWTIKGGRPSCTVCVMATMPPSILRLILRNDERFSPHIHIIQLKFKHSLDFPSSVGNFYKML